MRSRNILILCLLVAVLTVASGAAQARNEMLTVPVVLADYYGFAYYQAFRDHAHPYAWATAGVDALGWGVLLTSKKYSGLFLVNMAGISKTVYPLARLADGDCPLEVRRRAWCSVGTHAGTLLFLRLAGKPALVVHSWAPGRDGQGLRLAYRF